MGLNFLLSFFALVSLHSFESMCRFRKFPRPTGPQWILSWHRGQMAWLSSASTTSGRRI
jgi:hypothetical protein